MPIEQIQRLTIDYRLAEELGKMCRELAVDQCVPKYHDARADTLSSFVSTIWQAALNGHSIVEVNFSPSGVFSYFGSGAPLLLTTVDVLPSNASRSPHLLIGQPSDVQKVVRQIKKADDKLKENSDAATLTPPPINYQPWLDSLTDTTLNASAVRRVISADFSQT